MGKSARSAFSVELTGTQETYGPAVANGVRSNDVAGLTSTSVEMILRSWPASAATAAARTPPNDSPTTVHGPLPSERRNSPTPTTISA